MSKDFTLILSPGSPRAADWHKVFGALTVHIKAPFAEMVETPDGKKIAYMLDLDLLDAGQVQRLAEHMAQKVDCTVDEAIIELHDRGLPLLAGDDTHVTVARPSRWL